MCDIAIVAIGGKGTRLQSSMPGETGSKSFLTIAGRPALFWTLIELRAAGIRHLTLCGEDQDLLLAGARIAGDLGYSGSRVNLFRDSGKGVHGIPGQLGGTPEQFFFVAGHATVRSSHYGELRSFAGSGQSVFSVFPIERVSDIRTRTLVKPTTSKIRFSAGMFSDTIPSDGVVLSFPYLLSDTYIPLLKQHSWTIGDAVKDPEWERLSRYVLSSDLPEFDVPRDLTLYRQWINARRLGATMSRLRGKLVS